MHCYRTFYRLIRLAYRILQICPAWAADGRKKPTALPTALAHLALSMIGEKIGQISTHYWRKRHNQGVIAHFSAVPRLHPVRMVGANKEAASLSGLGEAVP